MIEVTAADFDQMVLTAGTWSAHLNVTPGRFEAVGSGPVPMHWDFAYWVGECWAAVVLARSFLESIQEGWDVVHDVTRDEYGDAFGYVILTNYNAHIVGEIGEK